LVKGTFKGDFEGKVYLVHGNERDSTFVKNRSFSFTGKTAIPTFSFVSIKGSKPVVPDPFYLGDGEILMEVDTVTKSGMRKSGKFEYLSLQTKFFKKGQTDRLIDSVSTEILERTKAIVDKEAKSIETKKNVLEFLASQPNTVASTVILQRNIRSFDKAELKNIYETLSPIIKTTEEAKEIFGSTIKQVPIVIGEKIADFEQANIKGEKISIRLLRGKYVLIDFWASWCIPCRHENPVVVKVYEQFRAKGFEVFGVSLDDKKERWLKAIKDDKLAWMHVSDLNGWNNEVAKMFNIRSIPDNILIDREGKILARSLRGDDLEKKLQEIFSKEVDK